MSYEVTIESVQAELESLKKENEGLRENVATMEADLKSVRDSKDYWYAEYERIANKADGYKESLAAIKTLINTILQ